MELRRLEVFIVVAEELNLRQAARRLGVSQPAITLQLQALENELGFSLLYRHQHRIAGLTPAGERYLQAARQTVMQLQLASSAAADIGRGHGTVLKVGICEGMATADLLRRAINIQLDIPARRRYAELPLCELIALIGDGGLDVGFLPLLPGIENPEMIELGAEGWLAVLPRNHRLCARDGLAPTDLRGETLILASPEQVPAGHQLVEDAFAACGVQPHRVIRVARRSTMLTLMGAGQGVTFLPESLSTLRLPEGRMIPFAAPPLRLGMTTGRNPGQAASQYMRAFAERIAALKTSSPSPP
ncbi:LysR family transcriptional regulator [Ottowia sp.]|uniref:LysR family transcriptional regulator n=1 Tax=Ottowia sp. TaxID=1898956 RepID=UPI0039E58626